MRILLSVNMLSIQWNYGIMELWNYGIMKLWNCGIMELWNHGIMELWNHGIELYNTMCVTI